MGKYINENYKRDWYLANKEKVLEQRKVRYYSNPEKHKAISQNRYYKMTTEEKLFRRARDRAKEKNIPFEITKSDIIVPDVCPILSIPLYPNKDKAGPNSPSLDRVVNSLGYVKDNIRVISNKANSLKSCLSVDDCLRLMMYMKGEL